MIKCTKLLLIFFLGIILTLKPIYSFGFQYIQYKDTPQLLGMTTSHDHAVPLTKKHKGKSITPTVSVLLILFKNSICLSIPISILHLIRSFISLIKHREKLLPVQFQSKIFSFHLAF